MCVCMHALVSMSADHAWCREASVKEGLSEVLWLTKTRLYRQAFSAITYKELESLELLAHLGS